MGAKPRPAQKLTSDQRPEARAESEMRRLHDAVNQLLASRVAQGFAPKVEDPVALTRIAVLLPGHEREQRSQGPVDD